MVNGRLTREDWVAVARKALIASGIDDVKVDVLAKRMKVTRGSFYWHFKHRQELLDALLDDWVANNRREIAVIHADGSGMQELFRVWLGEDPNFPAFDIAIRVWARKSKSVSRLVGEIDDAWIALLQSMLEKSGVTAPESFVRARIIYFHQIGYYALSIQESVGDRVKLTPYYYAALTGMAPPADLVDSLQPKGKGRARGTVKAT